MGTTPRVATPSQWLREAGEALQTANDDIAALRAENDRLQVRVSALHDVSLELRERLLAAFTVLRRMESDSVEFDPVAELTHALTGGTAEEIKWDPARKHPLPVGTLILSDEGESDCGGEPEEERETGPQAVGQIISVDTTGRLDGWCYTVAFGNGTTVIIEAEEIEDADAYAVAPAPFIAPEGV